MAPQKQPTRKKSPGHTKLKAPTQTKPKQTKEWKVKIERPGFDVPLKRSRGFTEDGEPINYPYIPSAPANSPPTNPYVSAAYEAILTFANWFVRGIPGIYLACLIIAYSLSREFEVLEAKNVSFVNNVSWKMFTQFMCFYACESLLRLVIQSGVFDPWGIPVVDFILFLIRVVLNLAYLLMLFVRINLFMTAFCYLLTSYITLGQKQPQSRNITSSMFDMRLGRLNVASDNTNGWFSPTWAYGTSMPPYMIVGLNWKLMYKDSFFGKLAWLVEFIAYQVGQTYRDNHDLPTLSSYGVSSLFMLGAKVFNIISGLTFVDKVFVNIMTNSYPTPGDENFFHADPFDDETGNGGIIERNGSVYFAPWKQPVRLVTKFARSSSLFCQRSTWNLLISTMGQVPDSSSLYPGLYTCFGVDALGKAYINFPGVFKAISKPLKKRLSLDKVMILMFSVGYQRKNPYSQEFNEYWENILASTMQLFLDSFFTYENFMNHMGALEAIGFNLEYFKRDVDAGAVGTIQKSIAQTMVGVKTDDIRFVDGTSVLDIPRNTEVSAKVLSSVSLVREIQCGDQKNKGNSCCMINSSITTFSGFYCPDEECSIVF
ncbi:MAG: hypothetical protein K0U20_08235 [Proteobacteria bacterium]|nr:hypothetical protein [Pseudomonadota bacterium]